MVNNPLTHESKKSDWFVLPLDKYEVDWDPGSDDQTTHTCNQVQL
jgi:hypothetical protein